MGDHTSRSRTNQAYQHHSAGLRESIFLTCLGQTVLAVVSLNPIVGLFDLFVLPNVEAVFQPFPRGLETYEEDDESRNLHEEENGYGYCCRCFHVFTVPKWGGSFPLNKLESPVFLFEHRGHRGFGEKLSTGWGEPVDKPFLLAESLGAPTAFVSVVHAVELSVVGEHLSQALLLRLSEDAVVFCDAGEGEAGHLHSRVYLKGERRDECDDAGVVNGSTCEHRSRGIGLRAVNDCLEVFVGCVFAVHVENITEVGWKFPPVENFSCEPRGSF